LPVAWLFWAWRHAYWRLAAFVLLIVSRSRRGSSAELWSSTAVRPTQHTWPMPVSGARIRGHLPRTARYAYEITATCDLVCCLHTCLRPSTRFFVWFSRVCRSAPAGFRVEKKGQIKAPTRHRGRAPTSTPPPLPLSAPPQVGRAYEAGPHVAKGGVSDANWGICLAHVASLAPLSPCSTTKAPVAPQMGVMHIYTLCYNRVIVGRQHVVWGVQGPFCGCVGQRNSIGTRQVRQLQEDQVQQLRGGVRWWIPSPALLGDSKCKDPAPSSLHEWAVERFSMHASVLRS
jgi:hypothetical protein